MAKGDSGKAQNMIDSQQVLAQNYLSMLQQQNQNLMQLAQQQMYGGGQDVTNRTGQTTSGTSNGMPDEATQQKIMDYINQRKAQLPATKDSLTQIVGELKQQGYDVNFARHGANKELESDDKIILPGGTMLDMIDNVGGSDAKWSGNYTEGPSGYGFQGSSSTGQNQGAAGQANADYQKIQDQYGEFAKTGGFSDQDIANIRSRAVSPIRSLYSSAQNAIERQRSLQGGYAPNYTAAMAKMAREKSQGMSDATTNAEAEIAQMKNQGRLAGLGGMSSMYGTTPGLANMYGNQMLSLAGQGLQGAGLQNQLGLGLIGGQINKAGVPSTFSQVMGNIGSVGRAAGGVLAPWL